MYAEVVAAISKWPRIAAVQGDEAVVFESIGQRVLRVPLRGGEVTVWADETEDLEAVAIVSQTVFWLAEGGDLFRGSGDDDRVLRDVVSVTGCGERGFAATERAVFALSATGPPRELRGSERPLRKVGCDRSHLYLLDGTEADGNLRRLSVESRDDITLSSGAIYDFFLSDGRVLWIVREHHPGILGGGFYEGGIFAIDGEGQAVRLASGLQDPTVALAHRGEILWQRLGGQLHRLDGSLVEGHARDVHSTSVGLVYSDPDDGFVLRLAP